MRARIQFARLSWLFCLFLSEVSSHNSNGGNEAAQAHLDNLSQAQEASLVSGGNKNRGTGGTGCEKLEIEFKSAGPLGIQFDGQLSIMAFTRLPGSRKGPAEKSGLLKIGDTLTAVNGDTIEGLSASDAFQVLEEAAAEREANGRHRVLEFCQNSAPGAPGEQRALSDYAAAAQGGSLEHLDVTDYNGEEQPVQAMLADGLGVVPEICPQANLVFVTPSYGCEERLDTSSESLKGSIAVVWRGGSCSFYRKASVLQSYNVVGVVVVNSEDDLFRMQMDDLMDNDIRVPVAMISFIDGSRLIQLQQRFANDLNRYLKARLVVSKSCLMQEQIELERQKEARELSKEEIQSGTKNSKQSVLTKRHQLYGSLAPAGTMTLHGDQGIPTAAFDFVSASWSGPLPIGSLLRMSQNKYLKVPVQEPVGLLLSDWEETDLDATLAQFAAQPSYFCLILISRTSSVFQLQGVLPSVVKFAVVMVTNRAGRALAQASSSSRIQLVPNHSVLHQWHQARPLENPDTWPSDPKLRSRLLARFQTYQTRHGSTDVHGPIPPSSCLSRHLADIASRLE